MRFSSILVIAFTCFCTFNLTAQEKPSALVKGEAASVSDNLVKVEIGNPSALGLSFEKKIDQQISIYSSLGFQFYAGGGSTAALRYGADPYYVFTPQLIVEPRFYHNLSKRAAMDKNVSYNAANYVALSSRVYHDSFYFSNSDKIPEGAAVLDVMLSYGLQRSFLKRLNLDMAIQPGIQFSQGQAQFFIGLKLQLGVIVFSK